MYSLYLDFMSALGMAVGYTIKYGVPVMFGFYLGRRDRLKLKKDLEAYKPLSK